MNRNLLFGLVVAAAVVATMAVLTVVRPPAENTERKFKDTRTGAGRNLTPDTEWARTIRQDVEALLEPYGWSCQPSVHALSVSVDRRWFSLPPGERNELRRRMQSAIDFARDRYGAPDPDYPISIEPQF